MTLVVMNGKRNTYVQIVLVDVEKIVFGQSNTVNGYFFDQSNVLPSLTLHET